MTGRIRLASLSLVTPHYFLEWVTESQRGEANGSLWSVVRLTVPCPL